MSNSNFVGALNTSTYLSVPNDTGLLNKFAGSLEVDTHSIQGRASQSAQDEPVIQRKQAVQVVNTGPKSLDQDFNGDGKRDIFWRNKQTGENAIWLMDGTTLTAAASLPTLAPSTGNWAFATDDFNGDGKTDIAWRNYTTGENAIWLMDGTTLTAAAYLPTLPSSTNWTFATADFNNDGKADFFWRSNTTGENAIWLMNGTTISATAYLPTLSASTPTGGIWDFGIADFNGDGKQDILWRNYNTGENAAWLIDGTTLTAGAYLPTLPSSTGYWAFATADFNGDGKTDIAWRNYTTGENAVWLMNGTTLTAAAYLPRLSVSTSTGGVWVFDIADFNGDGKADIALRNYDTGENVVWLMNGTTLTAGAYLPPLSPSSYWDFGIADFNGDGKQDILWRNFNTGENAAWLIDGTTVTASANLPTLSPPRDWDFLSYSRNFS